MMNLLILSLLLVSGSFANKCAKRQEVDSILNVNITFALDADSTLEYMTKIEQYKLFGSAIQTLLNVENTYLPFIDVQLSIVNINDIADSTNCMTSYCIVVSYRNRKQCTGIGNDLEIMLLSQFNYKGKASTLLFNSPTVLVDIHCSNRDLILDDIEKRIMPHLYRIIKVPIREDTIGYKIPTYKLFDKGNKAIVCESYKSFYPCNYRFPTYRTQVDLIDNTCQLKYKGCNFSPSVRPSNCRGFEILEKNKCMLLYSKQSSDRMRPSYTKIDVGGDTNIVRLQNRIIIPLYKVDHNLKIYLNDAGYAKLVKNAIDIVNKHMLNVHVKYELVSSKYKSNLNINVESCSKYLLGSAEGSFFFRKVPEIVLCIGDNNAKMISTIVHEWLHLNGISHDQKGSMSSIYSEMDNDMNDVYVVNVCPDPIFNANCSIEKSMFNSMTTKVVSLPDMSIYTDHSNYIIRTDKPVMKGNFRTIESEINDRIKKLTVSVRVYRTYVGAFDDNTGMIYVEDISLYSYLKVAEVSMCYSTNIYICTLIVEMMHNNEKYFLNLGHVSGMFEYKVKGDTFYVGCLNGVQLFHPILVLY